MTLNPILKVLSTFSKHHVRCLLIGGQACIIYGASEFSRDSDFVVLSSTDNLSNLRAALTELKARRIYVPPLDKKHLNRELKGSNLDIAHFLYFRYQQIHFLILLFSLFPSARYL